jgi:hypothetical protein
MEQLHKKPRVHGALLQVLSQLYLFSSSKVRGARPGLLKKHGAELKNVEWSDPKHPLKMLTWHCIYQERDYKSFIRIERV